MIYKVKHAETGKIYAMKRMNYEELKKDKKQLKYFQTEVNIMMKIRHPNILQAHDTFHTSKRIFVLTDYCSDGDLKKYMQDNKIDYFTEEEAIPIMK